MRIGNFGFFASLAALAFFARDAFARAADFRRSMRARASFEFLLPGYFFK